MASSYSKKQKTFHNKKSFYNQKSKKNYIEVGQRGFLATCNFREKDCIRECYNILNEYADELYGPSSNCLSNSSKTEKSVNEPTTSPSSSQQQEKEEPAADIADELEQAIKDCKKGTQSRRFQSMDTGTSNCIFIQTKLSNPVELGVKIVEDLAEHKISKTRYLLRLVPIETVCKANVKDIVDATGPFLDKHFLNSEKTFSVVFNRRYNNDVNRMKIIDSLAELVTSKGIKNKVDLKNPELVIIVEVIKGLCCVSVVPNYMKWKKYNLLELTLNGNNDINSADAVDSTVDKTEHTDEIVKQPTENENNKDPEVGHHDE